MQLLKFNDCRKGQGCSRQYTKQGRTSFSTRQAVAGTDHETKEEKMDVGKVTVSSRFTERHA